MDQELESFVNLLNKSRAPRVVPEELAHLPNWAQRALSKLPEPPAPQRAISASGGVPTNGVAPELKSEAKLTSEIAIEPPVPVPPADAAPPQSTGPIAVGVTEPDPVGVDPPANKIEPASILAAPIVFEEAFTVAAKTEPMPAPSIPPPERIDLAPATQEKIDAVPSLAEMFSVPVTFEPSAVDTTDRPPVSVAAIAEEPDLADVSPVSASADVVPPPPPLDVGANVVAMPVRRRPLAYALAAAAVIAAVAVVAGGYWYANQRGLLVAAHVGKPNQVTPTPPKTIAKAAPPINAAKSPPDGVSASGSAAIAPVVNATPKVIAPPDPVIANKFDRAKSDEIAAANPVPVSKPETKAVTQGATPKPDVKAAKQDAPSKPEVKIADAPAPAALPVPPPPKPVTPLKEAKAANLASVTPATQLAAVSPPPAAETKPQPAAATPLVKPTAPPPVAEVKPPAAKAEAPPKQLAMLTPPSPVPAPPPPAVVKPAAVPAAAKAKGDEPTWLRNAVPAPAFSGQPQIAIVIDDLGLDRNRTQRAIALSGPVTLSFLAYASDLPQQTEAARQAGHELIVHVPMEPIVRPKFISSTTNGSGVVRDELLRRLRWDLNRFSGYVGVNNHMGNRLATDPGSAQTVIAELKARGLLFLDSHGANGGAVAVAERMGVPTVSRDIFLDDDVSATSINERLVALEKVAREHRTAIAIGHPHDQTLDALNVWLASLPSKGLQLVPLTAIVKDREQHLAGAN